MSNYHRVRGIVEQGLEVGNGSDEITKQINAAGLIALDLPPINRITGMYYPTAAGHCIGNITVRDYNIHLNINTKRALHPTEARDMALMLLAAADHAEQSNGTQ